MGEPWIRVHANLAERPVIDRAVDALGVSYHEAMGLLVEFWGNVSQHAVGGLIADVSDRQVERWANWRGEPGCFAGFIRERHTDEHGRINEWDEYAGLLEHRRAVDRERKRATNEQRRSAGIPSESQRNSNGNPQTSSSTIRDEDEDETKRDASTAEVPVESTSDSTDAHFTADHSHRRPQRRPSNKRQAGLAALVPTADEQRVLDHYRTVHPRRRPGDDKDIGAIREALARGYAPDQLCEAIDGNAGDIWHKDRSKHELPYVLRDNGKIDTFIGLAGEQSRRRASRAGGRARQRLEQTRGSLELGRRCRRELPDANAVMRLPEIPCVSHGRPRVAARRRLIDALERRGEGDREIGDHPLVVAALGQPSRVLDRVHQPPGHCNATGKPDAIPACVPRVRLDPWPCESLSVGQRFDAGHIKNGVRWSRNRELRDLHVGGLHASQPSARTKRFNGYPNR
jgi:hypothetical protein